MTRYLLSMIPVLLISPAAFAEEYLIRVEAVGYEDVAVSEKVPDERLFHSIEVSAGPDREFFSQVRMGTETLSVEGRLNPEADGNLSLEIKHGHEADTGASVPTGEGTREPVLDETRIETRIQCKLGQRILVGGIETVATSNVAGKESTTKSKRHFFVTIIRRTPERG